MNVDKTTPEGQLLQNCCNILHKVVGIRHAMMMTHVHDEQGMLEVLARYGVQDVQVLANMATEEAEQMLTHLKNVGIEPPNYDWTEGREVALQTMAERRRSIHGPGGGMQGQEYST